MNAALFDLDGTLIDSAPDIHAAACAMLRDLSLPELPFEEAREYVGDGMPRFVKRALTRQWWGEPDDELLQTAIARMQFHYARECTARRRVYAGVAETLAALQDRGVQMACVTNKPARFTGPVLSACGLDKFFGAVVSGDSLPSKKPDPAPLQEACRLLQVECESAWMVGDSEADAKAAAAAGCRFAVVSYGYHRRGGLPLAEKIIYNFGEVLQTIDGENQ